MTTYEQILTKAAQQFGFSNRADKCIEECAELIAAIHHYRSGKISKYELLQEIIGVQMTVIMLLEFFDQDEELYQMAMDTQMQKLRKAMGE